MKKIKDIDTVSHGDLVKALSASLYILYQRHGIEAVEAALEGVLMGIDMMEEGRPTGKTDIN